MNLNELKDKAYQCAIAHGWHEEEHSNEHWLCLVMSELMEAVQADRVGKRAGRKEFESFPSHISFDLFIKDSVEDELADACIRLFDLAGLRDIDLIDFTEEEMESAAKDYNDCTFTESIYDISTTTLKINREYYQLNNQINGTLFSVFGLARHLNIDILWHIEQKIRYNELRPYKHNKIY